MLTVDGGMLRRLRQEREWSRDDLVHEIRVKGGRLSSRHLARLETGGGGDVQTSTLVAIAAALGIRDFRSLLVEVERQLA